MLKNEKIKYIIGKRIIKDRRNKAFIRSIYRSLNVKCDTKCLSCARAKFVIDRVVQKKCYDSEVLRGRTR